MRPTAGQRLLSFITVAVRCSHGEQAPSIPWPPGQGRQCGGQWWRRVHDGLLVREPPDAGCPRSGGGSVWTEVESPDDQFAAVVLTVELQRGSEWLFETAKASDIDLRFAATGRALCAPAVQHAPATATGCLASGGPGDSHRVASERAGQVFCAHPEAKESRAFFCRFPPRFYGHPGICRQYSQFCPFEELQMETDAERIETAVVNIDAALFRALEECLSLKEELWIFMVFVHWCPHCQQLMPRLYRLALVLRQHGVRGIRFGAVNCATEHELCTGQKWMGHPLFVARYLGPKRTVHDAVGHWEDAVKDPQLRTMLPRYATPGEYPLLKILFEQLPENVAPKAVWSPLFGDDASDKLGACPNITEMHPVLPARSDDAVGNAWSDAEADFVPQRRWTDALLMVRHTLQEWILPIGDDGNVEAYSFSQFEAIEAWVALLAGNLPHAFGLARQLGDLHRLVRGRLRAAHEGGGATLCAEDWRSWTAPLLQEIGAVGQRDFSVPSACASDTCRFWSLLHTLAAEGFRREQIPELLVRSNAMQPFEMLVAVQGFIHHFFKCLYCRRHFLDDFERGLYGLGMAREDAAEAVLYFWRLHNAVSVRVAAEHGCSEADRRWPPLSLCPRCWDTGVQMGEWRVISEAVNGSEGALEGQPQLDKVLHTRGRMPRALRLSALPNEAEVLDFLMHAFADTMSGHQKRAPSFVPSPPSV